MKKKEGKERKGKEKEKGKRKRKRKGACTYRHGITDTYTHIHAQKKK